MNKAFEKILERLADVGGYDSSSEYANGWNSAIDEAISIVQEVAKEYKQSEYVNEIQEMALELAVYVLEEEYNKHAWLENANNETGVVVTYKDAICIIKDMLETDENTSSNTSANTNYTTNTSTNGCNDDGCYLDSGCEFITEAVAWQPLPQPYKESE